MRTTQALILSLAVAAAVAVSVSVPTSHAQHAAHAAPAPSRIDVPPEGVTIPMRDLDGRPIVEVRINDRGPYAFIFDTGASITVLGDDLNRVLALESPAGVRAGSPGGGAPPQIVTVTSLHLGAATIGGFIAAVMPLADLFRAGNSPQGVLSASSFPGYLVTFDYPGKRIMIGKGSLEAADSRSIFQYGDDQALPLVPVRIAGHETNVHLDTGSAFSLTLPRRFLSELPLKTPPKDAGMARLSGGTFPVSSAAVDGTIEMGRYKLDIPEVRFSDVRHGTELGPGNIGYAVLKDFVVTLDAKNRRVRLER